MAQDRSNDNLSEDQGQRLFQSKVLTAIFGRSRATLVMHSILIIAVIGGLAFITVGLLVPKTFTKPPSSKIPIGLQVGDIAPNFTLTDLNGKQVSLSDYRGKPVMLNFWYPSCSDCVHEVSTMQKYYTSQEAIRKQFVILAVNFVDSKQTVQKFVQRKHLTYPIVMDDQQSVATMYHVTETPTSYFLDSQGIIQSI